MAKKTVKKATTRRRRDKRKVERGQAHIQGRNFPKRPLE